MKCFTASVLSVSAFSLLLLASVIAPSAHALPKVDSDFKLQSLRLDEMDARNKANDDPSVFKLQSLRLSELDARNKSEENSKSNVSAH